jgi:DNA segregation ATPase FtsK/SpoIIIE-like protein
MARGAARKRSKSEDEGRSEAGLFSRLGTLVKSLFVAEDAEPSQHAREILGILMIFASAWLAVSMLSYEAPFGAATTEGSNWGGKLGYYLARAAYISAGAAGLIFAFLGFAWGCVLVARKSVPKAPLRLVAAMAFALSLAFLLHLALGSDDIRRDSSGQLPYGPGGWFAYEASPGLRSMLGGPGLWIVMLALTLVSFMLATNMAFWPLLVELGQWAQRRREERGESFLKALSTWIGALFLGLWDFLRGARLGETREALAAARTGQASATLEAGSGPKPARRAAVAEEEDEEEDEVEAAPRAQAPQNSKGALGGKAASAPLQPSWEEDDDAIAAAASSAFGHDDGEADPDRELGGEFGDGELDEDAVAVSAATDEDSDDYAGLDPLGDRSPGEEDRDGRGGAALDSDSDDADAEDLLAQDPDEQEGEGGVLQPALPGAGRAGGPKSIKQGLARELPFEPPTPPPGEWRLPPLDLLEQPDANSGLDEKSMEAQARKLEAALLSFRVEAQVCSAQVGPTVTLFELEVSQGTRMNKVTQLSQEIAAALRAQSVRIIAPIPGKATIGIEVPNGARRKVRISELVNQNAYDKKFGALPLFLGIDAEGNPIVEDLARMPHLLIAGTTGSGKSVCINTILASFLMTRSPHDVQMILIDPKMVELQMFEKIPHLMLPVVTDMRQATKVLEWAVEKMEGRYELFKAAGVKNLKGYNALGEEELKLRLGDEFSDRTPRHVPYIVLVVDEFADLMMQAKKEAEAAITRLAQKSRAVGIHVILATQRPSTDVITGVIKGNLPTRIAFQVASKVDSRVILDSMGAEKLLGGGDMLYNPPQSSRIKRVQGALVEDHEIKSLVDFVCQDSAQNFNQELKQLTTGTAQPGAGDGFESALDDPMWDESVRVILKSKRGSASLLQRALGIGYTRASRLLDMMGEAGIVSDHKGSKAREVLMTLEQWEEQHGSELPGPPRGGDA